MDSGCWVYCCYYSRVGACLYTLCSVPYPGPLPGKRKFLCYNFRDIPDFLIRFVLVSGVPCVGVGCLSKVSSLCVVNDRRFFVGTNLARWWTFYAFIRLIYWIHDHQATTPIKLQFPSMIAMNPNKCTMTMWQVFLNIFLLFKIDTNTWAYIDYYIQPRRCIIGWLT